MIEKPSLPSRPDRPLIVLSGMPRSGTTWVGKIFDSHPQTLYRHEPDSWRQLEGMPLAPEPAQAERYRETMLGFVRELEAMRATKVAGSLPVFPKGYYVPWRYQLRRLLIAGAKVLAKGVGEVPVPALVDYGRFDDIVVVWKSIESTARLGVIGALLPEARIVHLVRHPCGYVASVLRGEASGKFTADEPSSEDLGLFGALLETPQAGARGLTLEGIKAMRPIERMALAWVLFNEKAMEEVEGLRNAVTLRYEDFCADPLQCTSKAFSFAGLSWNAQTEAFLADSTSANNESYYSVRKNPKEASSRWKSQLSVEDIELIAAVVKGSRPGRLYF